MCALLQNVGLCKALHEFQGESGEELSFSAGEIIETTEKVNDEWLKGRVGSREGMFPVAFVDVVKEIPTPSAAQKTAQQPATAVKGGKKSGELFTVKPPKIKLLTRSLMRGCPLLIGCIVFCKDAIALFLKRFRLGIKQN